MKELSIEEKAKRYDEVIKKVNDYYEGKTKLYSNVDKTLGYLFPTLKDSDDEKIRKELIEYLKFKYEDPNAIRHDYEKWIAWLEKQCEQKRIWSKEDEIGLSDALWAIKQVRTIAKDENDMGNLWYAERWLKLLKERLKG